VCQLARKHVTVALSGDGGDESFGGYRRYRMHLMEEKMRAALPMGVRRPLFGLLGRVYPKADWAPRVFRAKTTFQAMARDAVRPTSTASRSCAATCASSCSAPISATSSAATTRSRSSAATPPTANTDDPLALIQYLDLKTYLVGDINTKVDRASMAHSLEVREPLMDHKLVEWLATLPSGLKIQGNEGKYLFKKAMEPCCPTTCSTAPRWASPCRSRAGSAARSSSACVTQCWAKPWPPPVSSTASYLQHLVDAHQSGARDYSAPLWTLLMFEAGPAGDQRAAP
jgi:asparagine synthase (glutamine-hydrolysing)